LLTENDKVLLMAVLLFVWLSAYDTNLMVLDELTGRVVLLEARPLWAAALPTPTSKVKPQRERTSAQMPSERPNKYDLLGMAKETPAAQPRG
jgi:hypothetical protein